MSAEQRARSRATQVTIMGQEYVLSGDIDPDYMNRIAGYVNARMKDLHDRTIGMSTTRLAVLTAMNIADELFSLKAEIEQADSSGSARVEQLESRINAWLHDIDKLRIQDHLSTASAST